MISRPPFRATRDLLTETVSVNVSFDAKTALTEAARRAGKPAAELVREAVSGIIERDNAVPQPPVPGARR